MATIATETVGPTRSVDLRVPAWGAAAVISLVLFGPIFLEVLRPPTSEMYGDFVQEWSSARNFIRGDPIYLPMRESMRRETGRDMPRFDQLLPWNAHPPVAVLAAIPFGLIPEYRTAHLIWNLVTLSLFLAGLAIILIELRVRWHWWSIFPAITLLLANNPLTANLLWGQVNFPILFLLAVAWRAERRGYSAGAGIAIGLATAFKLFPGLVLIYFLANRAWREAVFTVLAAAAANAAAVTVFGWDAFTIYVRDVLPSLEVFRGAYANVSLTGYWTRVSLAVGMPTLGSIAGFISQLAVVAILASVAWRARTRGERDRAFALAVVGMPLVSPIAWAHYFVILALPLLMLWQRLPSGRLRILFIGSALVLFPHESGYPDLYKRLASGQADNTPLSVHFPVQLDPGLCIIGLGFYTLALLTILLLLACARLDPPTELEPVSVDLQ